MITVQIMVYSGTPIIQTPIRTDLIVLIKMVSTFQSLKMAMKQLQAIAKITTHITYFPLITYHI